MGSEPSKVLELVVFKLRDGTKREEFLATADGVSEWARTQPGFISRELAYDAEGNRWIEVIWWKTMDDAKASAEAALSSESCAPMFALIDEESTLMIHGEPAIAPVSVAGDPVEA
jgi:antibiotic biosynthesis monooxygenase (ABM) superfamily enzyme